MPFNGSGVFQRVRNWVADATAGIKVRADFHDSEDDGFAAGISNCIARDGQSIITQNIPFNSKRITGLADPVNAQDGATKAYADTKLSPDGDSTIDGQLLVKGDITIEKVNPSLILNSDVGGSNAIVGREDDKARWVMYLGDDEVETGVDNIGSDFVLDRHNDAGVLIDTVLEFDRGTGLGKVLGPPTDPKGILNKESGEALFQAKDPQLFAGIPINAPTIPYTLLLTDAQKAIKGIGAVTIPLNSSVAFPIGTAVSFIAFGGTMTVTLPAGDRLFWNNGGALVGGGATAVTRTISNCGIATALKVAASDWVISGSGIT